MCTEPVNSLHTKINIFPSVLKADTAGETSFFYLFIDTPLGKKVVTLFLYIEQLITIKLQCSPETPAAGKSRNTVATKEPATHTKYFSKKENKRW